MRMLLWGAALIGVLSATGAAFADAPPSPAPSVSGEATPVATPSPSPSPTPQRGPKVTGTLDGYYELNFNNPPGVGSVLNPKPTLPVFLDPVGVQNVGRAFDFKAQTPTFNLARLTIDGTGESPIGYKLDLIAGPEADSIANLDPMGGNINKFFSQAYLQFAVHSSYGDHIDVGKWLTWSGIEDIYASDDFNYSRGLLFTFATPDYHAGIRWYHYYDKDQQHYLMLTVNNGWNDVNNATGSPTFGLSYQWKPSDKSALQQNLTYGQFPVDNPAAPTIIGAHVLWDTIFTYNPNDKTTWQAEFDYDNQQNTQATLGVGSASWYGLGVFYRRQMTEKSAVAVRAEMLQDENGFTSGRAQTLKELTVTYEWRPNANILWRLEGRVDSSNQPFFLKSNGFTGTQPTILIAPIVFFP